MSTIDKERVRKVAPAVEIDRHGVILEKTNLGFENDGAFNPGAYRDGEHVHLLYRAVRHGNYSSVGYALLNGPLEITYRNKKPILHPEKKYESQGIEDPRLTRIDDTYYLSYSVYDRVNVSSAYATSTDLKKWRKHRLITPRINYRDYKHFTECCTGLSDKYHYHYKVFKEHGLGPELYKKLYVWDKDVMFFPKKIDGKFAVLHRLYPGIQVIYFEDRRDLTLAFWEDYLMNLEQYIVMDPEYPYESSHIGAGAPPIETEEGWLLIYHAAQATPRGVLYHASAALLDLEDPTVEISRLRSPLFSPKFPWEKKGVVNNIIFPSGTALFGDDLYIYYGAADERVAVASVKLSALLAQLKLDARHEENH